MKPTPVKLINKKTLFFSLLFTICLTVFNVGNVMANEPAPDFTFKGLDNSNIKISDFKGDVVYVDFWATWCPPCRKSFPWMDAMHQKYKDLGFKIIAVSLDTKREIIDDFVKKMAPHFTIAHDPSGDSASAFKVKGMPSSYLIDRKGNIYASHAGFTDSDKPKLETAIKKLLSAE